MGKTFRSGAVGAAMAGALWFGAQPARASHDNMGSLALGGLLMANMTMLPSYYAVGYYAFAAPDKPMPSGWATMNCATAALGASVGFYGMYRAGKSNDLDHGNEANHTEVLLGVFGGVTVATSIAVIASSIVMARRPGAEGAGQGDVRARRRFMVLPSLGPGEGGLGLVGVF